ncbi:MAG: hypothetical protein ACTSR8_01045 [Promethearchaeota archaeon]
MELPKICPAHKDKVYMILNISRIVLNLLILSINVFLMMIFLVYSVFFNFVFGRLFLCNICIYKQGSNFKSVKEYQAFLGKKFAKRMKIMFPLLFIDWFLPFIFGLIIIIIYWIELGLTTAPSYRIIIFLVICMMLQILLTQFTLRRTPKIHCKECLYRNYCPIAQNKWNI